MLHRLNTAIFLFLLLSLSSCVISPRRDITTTGSTGTGQLYVVDESANAILRFAGATAVSGNVRPTAAISGSSTELSDPRYIFLDAPNNSLYVANAGGGQILVFTNASTLNGNVMPTRVITSPSLVTPTDVALDDSTNNLLYVADNLAVVVFANASTINNATTAQHVIQLSFTPSAILLDAVNDRLFVADPTNQAIDVFDSASTLTGSVAASRTITGTNTLLAGPSGMRIDGAGRLIVSNSQGSSITIYTNAATTSGNIAPVGMISGSSTQLAGPAELALDPTTNSGELYVANPSGANVTVFSSITSVNATLNATPNRNLFGGNTTLNGTATPTARGVALDTTR